jgi:hypothetical protein
MESTECKLEATSLIKRLEEDPNLIGINSKCIRTSTIIFRYLPYKEIQEVK